MPTDPRTPVLVGVGQVTRRPDRDDPTTWTEPLALMVEALTRAAVDAGGGSRRSPLLERVDEATAVASFVWRAPDPARAVLDALGLTARTTRVTGPGGTVPQTALFDAARRIARGELDVAVVVGAEAMKSGDLARRRGDPIAWHEQPGDVAAAPIVFEVPDALCDEERALGMALPVATYALFEQAIRRGAGRTRASQAARLDALAARMHAVAATVEGAWLGGDLPPGSATEPGPSNRMVSTPYTKLLASNVMVDMGAALLVASLEAARRAGVPEDRLVFPQRVATAKEQWLVSSRHALDTSLAMAACAEALFAASPDPDHVDLYSCFPSAVQLGCSALGLDPIDGAVAPTVTGGMTFFGGPGNNYVTHSIAQMAERLRADPGATGLVTALGWYASTHAWATYATSPPAGGFAVTDAQPAVDAAELRATDWSYEGPAEVEAYTVGHDRDGGATRAIVSVLTPKGARRILATDDAERAAAIEVADPLAHDVAVRDGAVELS